jgi:hypothetical protein
MFARIIGIAAARKGTKRWDPTEDPEELRILKEKANFYKFSTYPWSLWIMGTITLSIGLFLSYYLYFISHSKEYLLFHNHLDQAT